MPEVTRRDPFKNFRFRVKFSGETAYIAGISKVSGLKRTIDYFDRLLSGSIKAKV